MSERFATTITLCFLATLVAISYKQRDSHTFEANMNLRKSIKAVLTHMDADRLIILCYDQFPKLYATFEPPKPSQKVLIALLLDHAEETHQLKRLAKRLGLLEEKEKKAKPDKVSIRIGNIGGNFSGNIAGGNIGKDE